MISSLSTLAVPTLGQGGDVLNFGKANEIENSTMGSGTNWIEIFNVFKLFIVAEFLFHYSRPKD